MIAALHQRTEAYKLLVDLYGADPEVRDYSGKKARNYFEPAWAPKEDLYQQYPGELEDIYNRYVLKYRIPIISVQPLYSINKITAHRKPQTSPITPLFNTINNLSGKYPPEALHSLGVY